MGSNAITAKSKEPQNRIQQLAREVMSEITELAPAQGEEMLGVFVTELFLLAEERKRRETRRQRQAEGIAAAKARGVRFGPSRKPLPDNFDECYRKWREGEITMREAAEACGMAKSSFYDAVLRKEQSAERAV